MPEFWPNGARLAVTISMMCESGGQVRPDSIALGPLAALPIPTEYPDYPTETYFEYGYREGIPRLLNLWDKHGISVSAFVVGKVAERFPELIGEVSGRGHECAAHVWEWVPQYQLDEADEREMIARTVAAVEAATGVRPVGWNCHGLRRSARTVELLAEQGFTYHIDDISRDEPFVEEVGGRPFVTVPYTMHINDLQLYELGGASTLDWYQALKDEFDVLYAEGAQRRRMLVISSHDRVMGRPARTAALDRFLSYVREHDDVWFARRDEIASYMLEQNAS